MFSVIQDLSELVKDGGSLRPGRGSNHKHETKKGKSATGAVRQATAGNSNVNNIKTKQNGSSILANFLYQSERNLAYSRTLKIEAKRWIKAKKTLFIP